MASATSRSRRRWQTLRYTAKLVASETFGRICFETLRAFAIAFALVGRASASLVGFWLGFDRLSGDVLEPMIVALYAIPKLTLYPILLLAFGLGLVGQGRVRRAARRHPDHPVHARRRAQHQADPASRPAAC